MNVKTKSRNSFVPFLLDEYDADQPEGSPRVVARCDTRTGQIWWTKGSNSKATRRGIRAALGR